MSKTTHKVEVVPLVLKPHPNADKLSVVEFDSTMCVVNTESWRGYDRAAYLQPDTLVPDTHPAVEFLLPTAKDGKIRIKGKNIRGIISLGLLVPAPPGAEIGDDVAEYFQAERYEPPMAPFMKINKEDGSSVEIQSADNISGPSFPVPKYDLEPGAKFARRVLTEGEKVLITLKIHGENCRMTFSDGTLYVGSRTQWKKEHLDFSHVTLEYLTSRGVEEERAKIVLEKLADKSAGSKERFWRGFRNTPNLENLVRSYPDHLFYGESYGEVGGFPYDCGKGNRRVRIFDILTPSGVWMNQEEARNLVKPFGDLWVPVLGDGIPFNLEECRKMAEGSDPLNPSHVREGVVVQPWEERVDEKCGRVKLKFVGLGYLEKN